MLLAHYIMQDHIILQTKKDDDTEAVIVHEEAAKPFFAWPFGGQTAPDGRKNEERETPQKVTATMEPLRVQRHNNTLNFVFLSKSSCSEWIVAQWGGGSIVYINSW